MLCPKCRSMVKDNTKECPYCGVNVKKYNEALILRENEPKEEYYEDYVTKVDTKESDKTFRAKRDEKIKKLRLILPITLCLLIILIIIIRTIIGKNKIEFDDSFDDINYNEVIASKLKYKVKLKRGNLKNVIFSSECGILHFYNGEVLWDLEEEQGVCEITASYKKLSVSKSVNIIPNMFLKTLLLYERKENNALVDSDLDGLMDDEEIRVYNTDPNNNDTDNDGLSDYDEIKLKTNPNNFSSLNDNVRDGDVKRSYSVKNKEASFKITGYGNVVDTKITKINKKLNKDGIFDRIYSVFSLGKIVKNEFSVNYKDLKLNNIDEDNLTLFIYYPESNYYQQVDSKLNKKEKQIKANDIVFGYYVIGDINKVNKDHSGTTSYIIDTKDDKAFLFSDSKFDIKRDSLINGNFVSSSNKNGHSYGIHSFVRDFYNRDIELSKTGLSKIDLHSYVYVTPELKYSLGFDIFEEEIYKDLYVLNGNKLALSSKYREEIESSRLYDIVTKEYNEENYLGIKYVEVAVLNDKGLNNLNGDDKFIFKRFSSKSLSFKYNSNSNIISKLSNSFNNNKIVVLGFNSDEGFNVVNGVSLSNDIINSNVYYIGIYDVNYKDEIRYLKIQCNINNKCVTMKNSYYNTENELIYLDV